MKIKSMSGYNAYPCEMINMFIDTDSWQDVRKWKHTLMVEVQVVIIAIQVNLSALTEAEKAHTS